MAKAKSPPYPSIGLEEAIKRIEMVYKADAQNRIAREAVAKDAGYSGLTGPSLSMLSALKKYGLLGGSGDECYVSDLALQIIAHPKGSAERATAIRDAASRPTLFVEIGNRFKGSALSDEALRAYLLTKKFLPNKVDGAISAYRETMTLVSEETGEYDSAPRKEPRMPPPAFGPTGERTICRYDFEPAGAVVLSASGPVSTEEALDTIETLIKMKREELKRRAEVPAQSKADNGEPIGSS